MVILLHNVIFALFMLLSPVLVVAAGGSSAGRRAARRTVHGREHSRELERFHAELRTRVPTSSRGAARRCPTRPS